MLLNNETHDDLVEAEEKIRVVVYHKDLEETFPLESSKIIYPSIENNSLDMNNTNIQDEAILERIHSFSISKYIEDNLKECDQESVSVDKLEEVQGNAQTYSRFPLDQSPNASGGDSLRNPS